MGSGTIGQIGAFKIINHEPQRAQDYAHIFSKQIAGDLLHRVNNTPSNATMNQQFNNIDYSGKIDKQGLDVAPNTIDNLRAEHNVGKDKIDYQIREQADQQMHEQQAEIALQEQYMQNDKLHRQKELKSEKETVKNQQKELEDAN
jgi:3-oxoacyl-[acyl-carrier-protein] synthase III